MRNKLCAALGIEKPIVQGPMSWVSTAPLVVAVSEAGGLGVLGTAAATPDFIAEQVGLVKKRTQKPFAINMGFHPAFLNDEYFNAVLGILTGAGVAAVHLDTLCDARQRLEPEFAARYFGMWKASGIKILAKIFTMHDAQVAEGAGADVIIAKGWEGGGHTTMQSTMVLVPQAAACVTVPVIASGGIAEGSGMAAALVMGASGVEMGTAFLAASETDIHENAKKAILDADDFATVAVGGSTNMECRQLRNALSDKVAELESALPPEQACPKVAELTQNSLRLAMREGDVQASGAVMAGQIVGMVRKIRPAREIIDETLAQCARILNSAPDISLR